MNRISQWRSGLGGHPPAPDLNPWQLLEIIQHLEMLEINSSSCIPSDVSCPTAGLNFSPVLPDPTTFTCSLEVIDSNSLMTANLDHSPFQKIWKFSPAVGWISSLCQQLRLPPPCLRSPLSWSWKIERASCLTYTVYMDLQVVVFPKHMRALLICTKTLRPLTIIFRVVFQHQLWS